MSNTSATKSREHRAIFRCYAELNDFLPREQRGREIVYRFDGNPGIKDAIEALGVPHTEVDLLLVNGDSCAFDYQLRDGDRVSVYPVFESFAIAPLARLREAPLRRTAFVLDTHLGKLARLLRLLGFDVLYRNDYADRELVDISVEQHRIILTRDRRLLFRRRVTHACYIRSHRPEEQVREVIRRFQLEGDIQPFHRCMTCNGPVRPVAKAEVVDRLFPKTSRYYDEFHRCEQCGKVYWRGPHFANLQRLVLSLQSL